LYASPIAGWKKAATPTIEVVRVWPRTKATMPESAARPPPRLMTRIASATAPTMPRAAPNRLAPTWLTRNCGVVT
jgi:hypothetical protein